MSSLPSNQSLQATLYLTGSEISLIHRAVVNSANGAGLAGPSSTQAADTEPVTLGWLLTRWTAIAAPDMGLVVISDPNISDEMVFAVSVSLEERRLLRDLCLAFGMEVGRHADETLEGLEAWEVAEAAVWVADRLEGST